VDFAPDGAAHDIVEAEISMEDPGVVIEPPMN